MTENENEPMLVPAEEPEDYGLTFKSNPKQYEIAERLLEGKNREETIRELIPQVGETWPFIYSANSGGMRRAKPRFDQYRLFIYEVQKTISALEERGWELDEPYNEKRKWTSKERLWVKWRTAYIKELIRAGVLRADDPDNILNVADIPEPGSVTPITFSAPKVPTEVEEEPVKDRVEEIEEFYNALMVIRDFVVSRELSGTFVDFISTRALKDGCKAIAYGIKPIHVIEAITKTWPIDTKRELKDHRKSWEPKENKIDFGAYKSALKGAHIALGYAETLALARIPIFLVGPSGSGKSFLARDLADSFELDYGEIPLTAGATPSWLVGAETITGYKSRPFVDIYENGGVFCFEELDASDPNMLLLVNNALANESFMNPVTGQELEKHADFIPVATANTWGLGATRQYTGRERLDMATLDRFRVGRIEVDYDRAVEQTIVKHWKKEAKKLQMEDED